MLDTDPMVQTKGKLAGLKKTFVASCFGSCLVDMLRCYRSSSSLALARVQPPKLGQHGVGNGQHVLGAST